MTSNTLNRAIQSQGASNRGIYQMITKVLLQLQLNQGTLVDVGCGKGDLWSHLHSKQFNYLGIDAVRYPFFPDNLKFIPCNLDNAIPLDDQFADIVISAETIEHLENPRAFMRELVRITKPGGTVIITTPNQLSLLSKLTLIFKNQFNAFQSAPGLYPSHITALLEIDLIRISQEVNLVNNQTIYSNQGRIPFVPWHWPQGFRGQMFSDNLLCVGHKPVHE